MKICSKCGEDKSFSEFQFRKDSNSYRSNCKLCHAFFTRNHYLKNREKILLKHKDWKSSHKKEINEQARNRRKTDIIFKLKMNLRNHTYRFLKGINKEGISLKKLGCSVEFLKNYFESKFIEGMTWDNYGRGDNGKGLQEWNIDHIIPLASFDLTKEEEQRKACNWTNLQPMWAKDNKIKQDKICYTKS